ncbi:MAG: hypothetical protein ACRDLS_04475 [Solirubrobacteraceae bacterium]
MADRLVAYAPRVDEDARAWVRWWRLDGLPEMRNLLWDKWDPLSLRGEAPEDEYDSYANVLASKLRRGNTRHDIADYLTTCLSEDGIITPRWRQRCEDAAQALLDWYEQSDAPR